MVLKNDKTKEEIKLEKTMERFFYFHKKHPIFILLEYSLFIFLMGFIVGVLI